MAASVFISFASTDRKTAMTICSALEARGFKCWISARDIMPGENFQSAIVKAIRGANVMLLVFTGNSNASEEMSKELALASQRKMPVIPLRVEDVAPNDAFAYEFATRQWIDFFADWEFAISQLAAQISKIIEADPNGPKIVTTPVTIESKGKGKAAAAAAAASASAAAVAGAAPEPASFLAETPGASDTDLVGVLDPPADHTFDSDPAAEDAPVKKGPGALLFVGAAVVIAVVIGIAVFTLGGQKKAGDTAAKPAAEQTASKSGPAAPPTPPQPTAPAPDAVTQAGAAPSTDPAAGGAAPAATAAAAPAATTAARPKRAAAAPAKKHAPLRASRSDVPY